MIRAHNISRRYGDFTAVDDVSFNINSGEIVGLLGHNGAGKTTIMKMLTGYIEPSAGLIEINDQALAENANDIQQLIGYLPENLPVYPEMTVMDYLFYCSSMRNIPQQELDMKVMDAIRKTELASKALAPISTLSRGFKQRVGVAQALIHNPKILILDEPTNGLDPHQTHQMRDLIRGLAKQATVIISTHIMQEVDALCDRVLILDSGQLAVDQTMEELRQSDNVSLETNADENAVNSYLAEFYMEQNITDSLPALLLADNNGSYHYQLPVGNKVDSKTLCSSISQKLVAGGAALFAINPQYRDLETVFRNIHLDKNNKQEVSNVA
ncbi:ABC-2 type transport system ATP-binding protein [Alteromonadaceae bacterium Bs31]|nr:ABC-2 type transport system ATP-binding protein [Alteromonadaceae bacterium Bs31]